MSEPVSTATPREVFERVLRLILERQYAAYVDLFAADAMFELPFAPPGVPRRIEGREQIRVFMQAGRERVQTATRQWEFHSIVVHETVDPEVIVTEFEVDGVATATGERYRFANLQVLRVRNGEIVSLRDYWNPLDRPELAALARPANAPPSPA
jgi:ketosteroid isomerase-like protein